MNLRFTLLLCGLSCHGPLQALGQPLITGQPHSQSMRVGATATFRVECLGVAPLRYQWRHNEGDLAGSTNAVLTLANVQPAQSGRYRVVVTDGFDEATISQTARLNVYSNLIGRTIVHDTFADGDRLRGPVSHGNSVWVASRSSSLLMGDAGSMQGVADPANSRLWVGYFTDEADGPVDLAVGDVLRVTLVFSATEVADWAGFGIERGVALACSILPLAARD